MGKKITLAQLQTLGACMEFKHKFLFFFGEELVLTDEIVESHGLKFPIDWMVYKLLTRAQRRVFLSHGLSGIEACALFAKLYQGKGETDAASLVQTYLEGLATWELADMAGCQRPDDDEKAGQDFLSNIRDSVAENLRYSNVRDESDLKNFREGSMPHEIADNAPDSYQAHMWDEFYELCAWEVDPDIPEEAPDMHDMARNRLYHIASNLVGALLHEVQGIMLEAPQGVDNEAPEDKPDVPTVVRGIPDAEIEIGMQVTGIHWGSDDLYVLTGQVTEIDQLYPQASKRYVVKGAGSDGQPATHMFSAYELKRA